MKGKRRGGNYGYLTYGFFKLVEIAGYDHDIGALFGKLYGYAFAHSLRSTCDDYCLSYAFSRSTNREGRGHGTLPSTGKWFLLANAPILSAIKTVANKQKSIDAHIKPMAIGAKYFKCWVFL